LRVEGTPRRLGTHPLDAGRSEFLEAIYHVVFGDRQAIAQPNPFEPFPVGGMLASRELPRGGITPMVGDKHLRVLSVFNLPKDTQPNMMEAFLTSAVAGSVYAQRMIFQDVRSAKSKIDFARRSQKGKNAGKGGGKAVDRYAQILEGKAEDALLAADVGDIVYTHYSAKVVFLNRDLEALLAGLDVVKRAFEAKGFTVNPETVNTLDGWFGMWPFNGFHDVREGQVHTMNAARMWPSSSRWAGRQTWTCKQCGPETVPALTGTTATGEPFYFDPHGPDSEQNFVQFGSPGVGKTTDLNAIAASYRRRPTDAVRAIDKNRGQLVTCKFLGGSYHDDEKYWLFGDLERQEKRWKVAKFLTNLGAIGGVEIGFEQRNDVQRTLELMLEYPAAHRSLSTFVNLLAPIDREGAFAKTLAQYQEGGVYRGRFDGVAPIETNADDSYEVHEMGALLGAKQDAEVAGPVMMWLLNSFEDKLPGRRTLIPWEEAWTSIHGVVASLIEELLRTIRYRHGGIGFFTHNLAEIKDSPIGKIVFATCPTRVIYPNRDAAGEFREFFEGLELSPSQIDAVKNGEAKKVKFLSVEGKFGAFSRTYSPAELAIYGCTGYDEVAAARRLIEEHPDDWDERQLRAYGCDREADRLRSLRRQRITHADARREALIR
jgi:type IV secretory pathway VirB4 component